MIRKIIILLAILSVNGVALGNLFSPPLIVFGAGYYDAGRRHSGSVIELEYRFGKRYFHCIRPQAVLISPELNSLFFGIGAGFEIFLGKHLVLTPNFSPGLYYKGSGRDLGFPLEFRSSFEATYQFSNAVRIGFQFWHISNASLSCRNPGSNALMGIIAFPL